MKSLTVFALIFVSVQAFLPHPTIIKSSWSQCQIKLYGVRNFIYQHDHFENNVHKRYGKSDNSLETLGMKNLVYQRSFGSAEAPNQMIFQEFFEFLSVFSIIVDMINFC